MESKYPAQHVLRSAWFGFLAIGVFSFFVNLGILISPLYMQQVFDRVLQSNHTDTLVYLTIIVMFLLVVISAVDAIRGIILSRLARWWDDTVRDDLLTAIVQMSRSRGSSYAHATNDLMTVRQFVGGPSVLPFFDAPWMPLFVVAVGLIHPSLGVLAFVSATLLVMLAFFNEWRTRGLMKDLPQHQARAQSVADMAGRHADSIYSMGMLPGIVKRYREDNDAVAIAMEKVASSSAKTSAVSKLIRFVAQIGVLGLGAYLATLGEISSGGMIAASIILGRALAPAEQAMGAWRTMVSARNGHRRLAKLFAEAPFDEAKVEMPKPTGKIDIQNASYVLPGMEKPILRNLIFSTDPGTVIGVVGPSGSGKSTLCRLLIGTINPTAGSVRLDGIALKNWDRAQLAHDLGYLSQTVDLLDGTIKQNIGRMLDVPDTEIVKAALVAGCHDMICQLPNGYDTVIGSGGFALSGGQRQMIGLARALLHMPKLVILDEPNSNLDAEGEKALASAVKNLKLMGSTVFLVSHRSATMSYVDTILTINGGAIEKVQSREDVVRDALKPVESALAKMRAVATTTALGRPNE